MRWGFAGLLLVLVACSKPGPTSDQKAQEEARKRNCPDQPTWQDCEIVMSRQAAAASASAAAAAEASKVASIASTQRTSATLTPDRRSAWIRDCVRKQCKQWQVDAIIAGAPTAEQRHLELVSFAAVSEDLARLSKDGSEVNPAAVGAIAGSVQKFGLKLLDEMPKTTVQEARKDPEGARGKTLRVSGTVIDIRKSGEFFEGNIALENLTVIHFLTSMSTDGIFDGHNATFRGVFMQEYNFQNVGGGQTRSLFAVGAFDLPPNR